MGGASASEIFAIFTEDEKCWRGFERAGEPTGTAPGKGFKYGRIWLDDVEISLATILLNLQIGKPKRHQKTTGACSRVAMRFLHHCCFAPQERDALTGWLRRGGDPGTFETRIEQSTCHIMLLKGGKAAAALEQAVAIASLSTQTDFTSNAVNSVKILLHCMQDLSSSLQ